MKLMYAAWGAEPARLRSPDLRAELRAAGASRLVVEVDDADVAEAVLRLTTYAEPVAAVLSVWTDADPAAVTRAVQGRAAAVAGWIVEERTPLVPPAVPDGERVDALVNVALLRRPEPMAREKWLETWLGGHTPVAIATQATFGYVQNVVVDELLPAQGRVDALVEEFFPMAARTDMHAFYGSGGDDDELGRRMTRMLESVAAFGADRDLDVMPASRYGWTLADAVTTT